MRLKMASSALIAFTSLVLAIAGNVSADQQTILSGQSFSEEVELDLFEMFNYEWDSNVELNFTIRSPSGAIEYTEIGIGEPYGAYIPIVAGTYTLTWKNEGGTVAQLDYTLHNIAPLEDAFDWLFWVMVVAAIIIVAVVIIVVVVVVMGGRKKAAATQQQMAVQSQMAANAIASGHCPSCGTPLDPNASFCARCGARFR